MEMISVVDPKLLFSRSDFSKSLDPERFRDLSTGNLTRSINMQLVQKYTKTIQYTSIQCFGSRSETAMDPHSMVIWSRIRIQNVDPDPEDVERAKM
jgi:hypothetical protein